MSDVFKGDSPSDADILCCRILDRLLAGSSPASNEPLAAVRAGANIQGELMTSKTGFRPSGGSKSYHCRVCCPLGSHVGITAVVGNVQLDCWGPVSDRATERGCCELEEPIGVQAQSARYVVAHRQRAAARIEAAPARRPFPRCWQLDLQAHPHGRLIFVRRSNAQGEVQLLGRAFAVDSLW